jgi:hypothetical protein
MFVLNIEKKRRKQHLWTCKWKDALARTPVPDCRQTTDNKRVQAVKSKLNSSEICLDARPLP